MNKEISNDTHKAIPDPSLKRLCKIYTILDELEKLGIKTISSKELGNKIGTESHTVRKDISYLDRKNRTGGGYTISALKEQICSSLGFNVERRACIVGIGKLGTVLMNYERLPYNNVKIIAGFDSSINRLETIKTSIPVYPSHEISNVIAREKIELAIIAVPGHAAVETADNLIKAGVKGIINFSSHVFSMHVSGVIIVNIDIIGDFRYLSALLRDPAQ